MSVIKDTFFGGAEKKAGEVSAAATRAGVAETRRQFDISQERAAPFLEAGVGALETQQALLGQLGPERAAQAFTQFQETPGQAFIRQQQERALLRNQSAIGGLGGGNIRTALQEQAAGRAATNLADFQNRLGTLSGSGQVTSAQLGQLGSQAAANIQSGLSTAGQQQASGILGQSQGMRQGIGQAAELVGFFSDIRLKKNIKKIGELKSGLGWYSWDWIDPAKAFVGNQPKQGVIAQEAAVKFPDSVYSVNGILKVNYGGIH